MTRTKKNAQVEQVNEVKNVKNAAAMPQVTDSKSALAGRCDELTDKLIADMKSAIKEIKTVNGRLVLAGKCAPVEMQALVKSGDFKDDVKGNLPNHIRLIKTDGNGNIVATYVQPVNYLPLAAVEKGDKSYSDYTISDVVEKWIGRGSSKGWALAGYSHDGNFVACTDFAELRHNYTHEVKCKVWAKVEGSERKVLVDDTYVDENGNEQTRMQSVTEIYVPRLTDIVADKVLFAAIAKALQSNWLKLFAK